MVTDRLLRAIQAAVPTVQNVSIGTMGVPASVTVQPATEQVAAQATINAFDWSIGADDADENVTARASAKATIQTAVDREGKGFRALAAVLLDEINIIRAALPTPLAARTMAQVKTAIGNKLDGGSVD